MARFRLDSSYARGTLRLLLHGTFDGSSAWELRHAIAGADANLVILDFAGIEEAFDFGAAVLGAGLKDLDRSRLRMANVPSALREVLDHFGVDLEHEGPPPAGGDPALGSV